MQLSQSINKEIELNPRKIKSASFLEKLIGYFSLLCFFINTYFKSQHKQMIFSLNPCHTINVKIILKTNLIVNTIYDINF